jgi:hypothetical protein
MGGSLASLAAAYLANYGLIEPDATRLYAFAAVHTGSFYLCELFLFYLNLFSFCFNEYLR